MLLVDLVFFLKLRTWLDNPILVETVAVVEMNRYVSVLVIPRNITKRRKWRKKFSPSLSWFPQCVSIDLPHEAQERDIRNEPIQLTVWFQFPCIIRKISTLYSHERERKKEKKILLTSILNPLTISIHVHLLRKTLVAAISITPLVKSRVYTRNCHQNTDQNNAVKKKQQQQGRKKNVSFPRVIQKVE